MRMSAIKHPVRSCSPEFKNSSADANAKAGKPADFIRPLSALRTSSSSSTIVTTFAFSFEVTMPNTYCCARANAIMLWYRYARWLVQEAKSNPKSTDSNSRHWGHPSLVNADAMEQILKARIVVHGGPGYVHFEPREIARALLVSLLEPSEGW